MLAPVHADFLTDEQRMIRDMAREFAQGELAPNAARWDEEGYVPDAVIARMGSLGLMGMLVPEEWGGTTVTVEVSVSVAVSDEVGLAVNVGVAVQVGVSVAVGLAVDVKVNDSVTVEVSVSVAVSDEVGLAVNVGVAV